MSTEREHSDLGSSGAERWTNCLGSIALSKQCPKAKATKQALKGTDGHDLAQICVEDFLNHKVKGTDPEIRFHLLTANSDPQLIEDAYSWRDLIWKNILDESITGKAWGCEHKFYFNKNFDSYGYADFWSVFISEKAKRIGAIGDYKTGYYGVPAKKNPQLGFLAVALRNAVREVGKDLDGVKTFIYQPAAGEGEAWKEDYLTPKQLDVWEKKFHNAAHDILIKQKQTLKVGDWCYFCNAKAICTKYGKETEKKTSLALVDGKPEFLPIQTLPIETVCKIALYGDEFIERIKACKAFVIESAKAGDKTPGVKVVQSKGRRAWLENTEAVASRLMELGVEEPYRPPAEPELKTITQIEKLIGKKAMDGLTKQGEGSLKIIPEHEAGEPIGAITSLMESVEL